MNLGEVPSGSHTRHEKEEERLSLELAATVNALKQYQKTWTSRSPSLIAGVSAPAPESSEVMMLST